MKRVFLAAAAVAMLAFPALGSTAGHKTHPKGLGPLGGVPPHLAGKRVGHLGTRRVGGKEVQLGAANTSSAGPTVKDDLTYGNADQLDPNTSEGGPVMHSSEIYAIYWRPAGYSQGSGTHYQTTINQFFTDVAAASGTATNVYSALQQYYDTTGNTAYDATFQGSAVDTDAFPANGCTLNQYDGFTIQNTTNCLDDTQLQTEIESFANSQHWDHGPGVQIFLFTPKNVASCISDPSNLSFGQDCSYSDYCAYHSAFFSGGSSDSDPADEFIYANMPWPNQQIFDGTNTYTSDCDGGDHPNGDGTPGANDTNAADEVLGVTSHEHNEAWSDPLGTGWWVDNANSAYAGSEDGDLCAWYFPDRSKVSGSPAIGSGSAYNQVINGHHYFIQGEWSNRAATAAANSGCVWGYAYPAETTTATISGTATVGDTLTGDAGTWSGPPTSYKYEWLRCDDSGDNCVSAKTVVSPTAAATYTVVPADDKHTMRLRVTGSNAQGAGAPALSTATAIVDGEPVASVNPAITGTATVGQTLTGNLGTWSPAATTYKIAWLRCDNAGSNCKSVTSATLKAPVAAAPTYALTKTDDKSTIRFQVAPSNVAGAGIGVTTSQTAAVNGQPTGGTIQLSDTTLAETPATAVNVGDTLTLNAAATAWTTHGLAIASYTVTWQYLNGALKTFSTTTLKAKNGVVPTTTTIVVPASVDRYPITVSVVAANAAGSSDSVTATTSNVAGQPTNSVAPSLVDAGGFHVGDTMTVNAGTWAAHGGTLKKYTFALYRCDSGGSSCASSAFKTLTSTTASTTYKLASGDLNHKLYVIVTVAGSNGTTSDSASSAKVGPVIAH